MGLKMDYTNILKNEEFFLAMVLLTIPISIKLNSLAIIVATIYYLIKLIASNSWKQIKYFFPSIIFFVIQLGSFAISVNFEIANKRLVLFLPFLLFPLYFVSNVNVEKKFDYNLFKYLEFGTFGILFYGLVRSIIDIIFFNSRYDYGYGVELLLNYMPHHVYLSIFILISICYLFINIRRNNNLYFNLYFNLSKILILFTFLIFLSSRTAIIIGMSLLPCFIFLGFGKRLKLIKLSLIVLFFICFVMVVILSIDYTKDKIVYFLFEIFNIETNRMPFYGVSYRFQIWDSCIELIKNLPFLGYGIGDVQYFLNSSYSKMGYYEVMNMNAHNQYLQFAISYGLFQTMLILYIIFRIILKAIYAKKYFILYSWIIIISFSFTESILNRQWGVIVFAFLLNFSSYQLNEIKKNS